MLICVNCTYMWYNRPFSNITNYDVIVVKGIRLHHYRSFMTMYQVLNGKVMCTCVRYIYSAHAYSKLQHWGAEIHSTMQILDYITNHSAYKLKRLGNKAISILYKLENSILQAIPHFLQTTKNDHKRKRNKEAGKYVSIFNKSFKTMLVDYKTVYCIVHTYNQHLLL